MRDYYEEQKERNSVARSARTVKGGKKKYMLPSDRMSASEIKKMNGEVTMYELKKPISWAKFRGYPKDIQKEYLQWFADEFSSTTGMMAQIFEISPAYCNTFLKKMGLAGIMHYRATESGKKAFTEWLKQYRSETTTKEQPPVEENKKEKVKIVEQPMFFNTITGCEMSMEGKASEIGQTLFSLFRDQKIAVSISFVGAKEEVETASV